MRRRCSQPAVVRTPRASGRATVAAVATVVAACLATLAAACDTNDGRELSPPVLPPPTTTIATSVDTVPGGGGAATTAPPVVQPFTLAAPWPDATEIPLRNTCDGDDVSPALSWSGVPDGAIELALVVTDDDADGFLHWLVTGIDPAFGSLLEGQVPQGTRQWPNSFGAATWNGPCPPAGGPHTYRFELHALNQQLEVGDDTAVDELRALIGELTLGSTAVTGTYAR